MSLRVALLHSVVLGQGRRVRSADLLDVARRIGASEARTVLSTGNLIFRRTGRERDIERALEAELEVAGGRRIPVILRSAAAWRKMVADCPLADAGPGLDVSVRVMRRAPSEADLDRIAAAAGRAERVVSQGRDLWFAVADETRPTPLVRAITAGETGTGTVRSLSSVTRIAAAVEAFPEGAG